VAADIGEGTQHAVLAAHQQQRHAGDLFDRVVTGPGQLPLLRDQLPAAREHRALLHRQHRLPRVVARGQGVRAVERFSDGVGVHGLLSPVGWPQTTRPAPPARPGRGAPLSLALVPNRRQPH